MKKLFLLLFAASLLMFTGCSKESDDWYTNLEEAKQVAKSENKDILVNFTGSDWCQWCKKLNNEVFSKDAFEKYADENLVLVKIDFPKYKEQSDEVKMYNMQLAQRFGVRGYPTIFLLDSNGEFVAQTGYRPGGAVEYIKHLEAEYNGPAKG